MVTFKPPVVCKLVAGKLLDIQERFVQTFNWIVSCWSYVGGGDGIIVSGVDKGRPGIAVNLVAGDNVEIRRRAATPFDTAVVISATGGGGDTVEAGDGISITEGESGKKVISADIVGEGGTSVEDDDGTKKIISPAYVKGDDTNIVFTPVAGTNNVKVDVYYT